MAQEPAIPGEKVTHPNDVIGRCIGSAKIQNGRPTVFFQGFIVYAEPVEDTRLIWADEGLDKYGWKERGYVYLPPERCEKVFKYLDAYEKLRKKHDETLNKLREETDKEYAFARVILSERKVTARNYGPLANTCRTYEEIKATHIKRRDEAESQFKKKVKEAMRSV